MEKGRSKQTIVRSAIDVSLSDLIAKDNR